MKKKTLHLPKEAPKRPTLADLERESVERSRAYVEQQLAQFKELRRTAGFED